MSDHAVLILIGLALVLAFLLAAIKLMRRPSQKAHDDVRMAAIERRLSAVEQQLNVTMVTVEHLPTAETVNKLASRITEVGGDVKALHVAVTATNRLVERIDQFLLAKDQ